MQDLSWLNREEYPFEHHYFETDTGRMHYVDEGQGKPVVMVHGTPAWSFLYRDLIKGLSSSYRVIAPDHVGFGLSDKPADGSYQPPTHAHNLAALIAHLGLEEITLMVHDFGGPIGLSYAIAQPENVAALVLFNTWMWSLRGNASVEQASRLMGGRIGHFLYTRLNLSPRFLLPAVMGDKSKLTKSAHQHYTRVFPSPDTREAPWTFARALLDASDWYDQLWQQRARIQDKRALILWGMKDPTFKPADLARWEDALHRAEVVRFPEAGHFVQEEEGARLLPRIEHFLDRVY